MARGRWIGQPDVRHPFLPSSLTVHSLYITPVADPVGDSEALYEDESFSERELAALVAAKVYYQLQEYNESMVFALGAGKLFDIHHDGEFEETILGE